MNFVGLLMIYVALCMVSCDVNKRLDRIADCMEKAATCKPKEAK